jgi:hypothetical protein
MKALKALAATLGFVLLLLLVYYVHVAYFEVNVVLYSAVMDAIVAAALAAALLFALKTFRVLNGFEKFQLTVIWLLAGYVFAISIPTVIDRSLSLYILEKIEQRGGGIQYARFEDVFTKEFAKEHHLVDVRLTEQLESGTVTIDGGCVKLTERGRRIAEISRYFRLHFLPKRRLLMGKYSDALTDPFRQSQQDVDYGCR